MSYDSTDSRSDVINSDKLQFVKIGATFSVASIASFGIFFIPFELLALYIALSNDLKPREDNMKESFMELASYVGIAVCVGFVLQAIATIFCTLVPRRSGAKTVIDVSAVSLIAALCIFIQLTIKKGSDPFGILDSGSKTMGSLGILFLLTHYITFALFFNNLSRSFGDHNGTALAKKMLVAFIVLIVGTGAASLLFKNAMDNMSIHAKSPEDALMTMKIYATFFLGSLLAMQIFAAIMMVQNVTNLNDTITRRINRR